MADPSNQMAAISKVAFRKQKLLNKSEYRVLLTLEDVVQDLRMGHRVMAQVSMGELLCPVELSADKELERQAYASINSKRLDFAVIDRFGEICLAVEYQGSGHYLTGAFMRDAVKREVLRKAGVSFFEIDGTWTPATLRARVKDLLVQTSSSDSRPSS